MGNPVDPPATDSAEQPTSANRSLARAMRWVIIVAIVVGGIYALQKATAPQVDENLISPIVISQKTGSDSSDSGTETDSPSNSPNSDSKAAAIIAGINQESIDTADHPLAPLLEVARAGLEEIDRSIQDYQATINSRVFAQGKLHDETYMKVKIRHQHENSDRSSVPFSVYMKFLKPAHKVGQEAIWVQGQNDGKLIAHATGLMNLKRFYLDPEGAIAMEGNRYPIDTIGFRNLLQKIIEFGEQDIKYGECEVTVSRNVELNGRSCIVLQVVHPKKRPHFELHISKIFLDDELGIPVAYEGYLWPEQEGQDPPLVEKYYYTDVRLNVGLTDADFDPGNEAYNYPAW